MDPVAAPEPVLSEEIKLARSRIDHELNLLGQRTTWLVTSQAFLLTAYVVNLGVPSKLEPLDNIKKSVAVEWVIPWTGVACILLYYITIAGALAAIMLWRCLIKPRNDLESRLLYTTTFARRAGMSVPLFIPAVFLATWVYLAGQG